MKHYTPSVSNHSWRIQVCLWLKNNEHFCTLFQLVFKTPKIIYSLHITRLLWAAALQINNICLTYLLEKNWFQDLFSVSQLFSLSTYPSKSINKPASLPIKIPHQTNIAFSSQIWEAALCTHGGWPTEAVRPVLRSQISIPNQHHLQRARGTAWTSQLCSFHSNPLKLQREEEREKKQHK